MRRPRSKPLGKEMIIVVKVMYLLLHVVVWLVASLLLGLLIGRPLAMVLCGILSVSFVAGSWKLLSVITKSMADGTYSDERLKRQGELIQATMRDKRQREKDTEKLL